MSSPPPAASVPGLQDKWRPLCVGVCVCFDPPVLAVNMASVEEERLGQLAALSGKHAAAPLRAINTHLCQPHYWCLFIHARPRQIPPH